MLPQQITATIVARQVTAAEFLQQYATSGHHSRLEPSLINRNQSSNDANTKIMTAIKVKSSPVSLCHTEERFLSNGA